MGQIVGESDIAGGNTQGFLWNNGVVTNLGLLLGSNYYSRANGINDSGQIVGESDAYAFLWDEQGGKINLGVTYDSVAYGVNNSGQVVGRSLSGGFLWENGVLTNLGGFNSYAINDIGQIVGSAVSDHRRRAFLWDENSGLDRLVALVDNGDGAASAINNHEQIVGYSRNQSGSFNPVLWENGSIIDLGTLTDTEGNNYGQASDVNNIGQIVGYSMVEGYGDFHAFLWEKGVMIDLNDFIDTDSGWVLEYAMSINDYGAIVGNGRFNGNQRAFLLKKMSRMLFQNLLRYFYWGVVSLWDS